MMDTLTPELPPVVVAAGQRPPRIWKFWGTALWGLLIFMAMFVVWPMRLCAAWAFLKMKRWGFRWMIITSWAYIMIWLGYVVNMVVNFPNRFGASIFGVTGWWVFDIFYMTPFLTLPWLYALDKRRWSRF